jgi:hypothetical protein
MTISTQASSVTYLGNGITQTFSFSFVADAAADIIVYYTNAQGVQTVVAPSQYILNLSAAPPGQLWGVGGTVTYPASGSPIAAGTSITISRLLPLTQETSISNQGNYAPEVTEQALDTLCMEIQQVSARTGQLRGVWVTSTAYNYGDIVQDGINGADTTNLYVCAIANTSGTWGTDLSNGYWSLAFNAQTFTPTFTKGYSLISTGSSNTTTLYSALIAWNSATTSAKSQTIPTSIGSMQVIVVSDVIGTAYAYPITVAPVTGVIHGVNSVYTNYGSITLLDSPNGWVSI